MSYRRRLLHGKIDILRAELVDRVKRRQSAKQSPISEVDIERLTEILAHRGPPAGPGRRRGCARRRLRAMYCSECGHHNREAARFCGRCGASLLEPDAGEPTEALPAIEAGLAEDEPAAVDAGDAGDPHRRWPRRRAVRGAHPT